mgnify:CR=1 FL=1
MITKLELPEIIFEDRSIESFKKKNFIFGKNGSGKSTITNEIEKYKPEYDVRIFQGYERIIKENNKLNVISLGEKNSKIEPEIQNLEKEIEFLNSENEDIFKEVKDAEHELNENNRELSKTYSLCSKELKNDHTEIFGTTYNKNNFEKDLKKAAQLSEKDVEIHLENLKQEVISIGSKLEFKEINLEYDIKKINYLLEKNLTKTSLIEYDSKELTWLEKGYQIHQHDDTCKFCGSKISEERYEELEDLFNENYKILKNKMYESDEIIKEKIDYLKHKSDIDISRFYPSIKDKARDIKLKVIDHIELIINFYKEALNKLKSKVNNPFEHQEKLRLNDNLEAKLVDLTHEYNQIFDENKEIHENLTSIKEESKELLDYHYVYNKMVEHDVSKLKDTHRLLETQYSDVKSKYDEKKEKYNELMNKLTDLKSSTISEEAAVASINENLKYLGN